MHSDAVALALEEMSSQENARGNPDSAMERIPSLRAVHRKIQFGPRIRLPKRFVHGFAVEAELRDREHSVGINPGIRTTDRILNFASPGIWKMGDFIHAQIGIADDIAETEAGNQVEITHQFRSLVPRITDKPFVGAFAGQHHFLAAAVDAS